MVIPTEDTDRTCGPQLTGLDRSHSKRSKPRSHSPGPRGGPSCSPFTARRPSPTTQTQGSRRGWELGSWSWEKGLPRLSPDAGKGLACSVVLASVGIGGREGPGYMPNTLSCQRAAQWAPSRSCSWDGWTLLQKMFIQTGGGGRGAALSSAQLGREGCQAGTGSSAWVRAPLGEEAPLC